ncbi:MAG: glycogen debranching enzyme N-terminal domain-containing protein [Acetatifactor sp.]|nr:glycogen debranching enzyme N-terminal domain-containing protein [Acetatifactor sp.]
MEFIYGKQDFCSLERGEENCWLMANGLGGFSSLTMAGSCSRNDHAVLMSCAAQEAPNHRWNMIHRLEEVLVTEEKEFHISSQDFGSMRDRTAAGSARPPLYMRIIPGGAM